MAGKQWPHPPGFDERVIAADEALREARRARDQEARGRVQAVERQGEYTTDPFAEAEADPAEALSEAELWEGMYRSYREEAALEGQLVNCQEHQRATNQRQSALLDEVDGVRRRRRVLEAELKRRALESER